MTPILEYIATVILLSLGFTMWIWKDWLPFVLKMFEQHDSTKSGDNHPDESDIDDR